MSNKKDLTVLVVEPGKRPYEKQVPNSLHDLQDIVGGSIEAIYPWDDDVALVCNEEALFRQLPFNRSVWETDSYIFGTFFICGLTEDDFGSLSEEQLKTYAEIFYNPEMLLKVGDRLLAIPVEMDEESIEEEHDELE